MCFTHQLLEALPWIEWGINMRSQKFLKELQQAAADGAAE
jgi:hypothetical protein